MAIACLTSEAEHAGEKLEQRGYALLDGSGIDLASAVETFDALQRNSGEPVPVTAEHPLVAVLLNRPAVRNLMQETLGPGTRVLCGTAFDQQGHASWSIPWHQLPCGGEPSRGLVLRWHLDLIGPADGGLRVLPGSHHKGHLGSAAIDRLAAEIPAVELAVSAGTVVALRPLLVQGARRRTTRGHRRILQVELAAGDSLPRRAEARS